LRFGWLKISICIDNPENLSKRVTRFSEEGGCELMASELLDWQAVDWAALACLWLAMYPWTNDDCFQPNYLYLPLLALSGGIGGVGSSERLL
jgi:hypothetical protein